MGNSWIRGMKKCRFEEKRMCKIFNGQEQWFICAKETFVLGPTCMICFAHIFVPDATVDLEMGLIFESYGILNQRFYRLHPFKVTTPKSSTCKNGTSALCHVRIRKTRYVQCTNCSELILRNPFGAVSFFSRDHITKFHALTPITMLLSFSAKMGGQIPKGHMEMYPIWLNGACYGEITCLINEPHFLTNANEVVTPWYRNQLALWHEGPTHLPNNHIEH